MTRSTRRPIMGSGGATKGNGSAKGDSSAMVCRRRAGVTPPSATTLMKQRSCCKSRSPVPALDAKTQNVGPPLHQVRSSWWYMPLNYGVVGRRLMSKQQTTRTAPAERRAGTYERDDDVIALLAYGSETILDVPRSRELTTVGTAPDRDLVLSGEDISAHHCLLNRRSRGLVVTNDASKNGLAYEVKRNLGFGLKPAFEDKRETGEGFVLTPGMSFVVGAEPHRFLALDDAMRKHYPTLVEILGREDEVRVANEEGEAPSPSDLILAADGPGHVLITGKPGCEHEELARIIHKISKRREQDIVEIDLSLIHI